MFRRFLFTLSLLGFSLNLSFAATTLPATEPPPTEMLEQESQQLSEEDIKRFVTSIAVIRHYYIKEENDNTLFDDAIRGMVSSLDPHSTYLDAKDLKELNNAVDGRFVGVGIEIVPDQGVIKVISPLDGSPAAAAGIKPGDLIIKVNNELVANLNFREAVDKIKGAPGTSVALTVLRPSKSKPLKFTMKRASIKINAIKTRLLDNHYGYVRISFFQSPLIRQLVNGVDKLKRDSKSQLRGLILDLRNNPGGLLQSGTDVADAFLDANNLNRYQNNIVYTKGRIPSASMAIKASPGDIIKGIPMVVLINQGSASASEIVAGALQDYGRAVVVGAQSFGKGSVQTLIPVSKDEAIKLTTALYYTPAGREIQAKGITPDVTVPDLQIATTNAMTISIDENSLENHLNNSEGTALLTDYNSEEDIKLAKEDYQLYQALIVLEGMSASRLAS
ncbi:MAG TPA: S41 family peptidase [Coxiellaceae bacterium]|nr:S41 family peptidase [Coxiellaceae bacterium]